MNDIRLRGFTLIEVMITVAIVAILAAVAYPSYRDSVLKGKRAEARAALTDLLQQQERFITQRNSYACFATNVTTGGTVALDPDANGHCPDTPPSQPSSTLVPFKGYVGTSIASAAYVLSADNCRAVDGTKISIQDCVRLMATPVGTHANDYARAGAPRITSTGIKDCVKSNGTVVTGTSLCWP